MAEIGESFSFISIHPFVVNLTFLFLTLNPIYQDFIRKQKYLGIKHKINIKKILINCARKKSIRIAPSIIRIKDGLDKRTFNKKTYFFTITNKEKYLVYYDYKT
ncbi:hypothetical protein C3943_13315 [Lysinibacillus sp. B2A1]|nr:hypothetical protein C3943_13315 [Lysinibacillus sp. B2A1]